MKNSKLLLFLIVVIAAAAVVYFLRLPQPEQAAETAEMLQPSVSLPITDYKSRRTLNGFGEYSQATLNGYHVGDDIEYADVKDEVPVTAIADGVIIHSGIVSGYGGVIVVAHNIEGERVNAIYGHVDISSSNLNVNDPVTREQYLANLGEDGSKESGRERKHLHFALYRGEDLRLQGYESTKEAVASWINPTDFFSDHGIEMKSQSRIFDPGTELGGDVFSIEFMIPQGWEVEYVKSLKALNLYKVSGGGTARQRSQVFVVYFDAAQFLTLSTVTIYQVDNVVVGQEDYVGRRYDIEKNPEVADFKDQPSWRSQRHIATDFRRREGYARYYSMAANPDLDMVIYQSILTSTSIITE